MEILEKVILGPIWVSASKKWVLNRKQKILKKLYLYLLYCYLLYESFQELQKEKWKQKNLKIQSPNAYFKIIIEIWLQFSVFFFDFLQLKPKHTRIFNVVSPFYLFFLNKYIALWFQIENFKMEDVGVCFEWQRTYFLV